MWKDWADIIQWTVKLFNSFDDGDATFIFKIKETFDEINFDLDDCFLK